MDTSISAASPGDELGRIVAFVNRRPWIMESSGGADEAKSNYSLDTLGITAEGDTNLHRLCAWHPTLEHLVDFLQCMHMEAEAEDSPFSNLIQQTNHKGVTCLHLAVYRNSYHASDIIQHLLKLEPALASTPMMIHGAGGEGGSYPLHILCGHNVTIQQDILSALLKADPTVVCREDSNGDTPLSLLWKNVQRFRWARQENIQLNLQQNGTKRRPSSTMMTITPEQCLDYSLQMIKAASHKTTQRLSLADICSIPRCPPLLVKLVLQYHQLLDVALQSPYCGMRRNAMHYAAINQPMTNLFALPICSAQSVLDLLLDALPELAQHKDQWGRIPLHYYALTMMASASSSGPAAAQQSHQTTTSTTLDRLIMSNPDSLMTKDPITGLYPFALVAMTTTTNTNTTTDTTTKMMMEEEEDDDDVVMVNNDLIESHHHLSTIVRLLRQFPEAAIYNHHYY